MLARIAAAFAWLVILVTYLAVAVVGSPVLLAAWAGDKFGARR